MNSACKYGRRDFAPRRTSFVEITEGSTSGHRSPFLNFPPKPASGRRRPGPGGRVAPLAGGLRPRQRLCIGAAPGEASLRGDDPSPTKVWAYNGTVPGPVLRVRQGEPVRILVENRLDEETTVHWHGIRLPVAMDGVPGISQPPIKPGEVFAYEFPPPDAGTFWYHPHMDSLRADRPRGLSGALHRRGVTPGLPSIADPGLAAGRLAPPTDDGRIIGGFGNTMEAMMSGRIGNAVHAERRGIGPGTSRPAGRRADPGCAW